MVQFWAHKEVIFVHYCVPQFAYCAVVIAEDFDAVEVCCQTVMTCVEPEICDCLFSGFVFIVFPCSFNWTVRVHIHDMRHVGGYKYIWTGTIYICILLHVSPMVVIRYFVQLKMFKVYIKFCVILFADIDNHP